MFINWGIVYISCFPEGEENEITFKYENLRFFGISKKIELFPYIQMFDR